MQLPRGQTLVKLSGILALGGIGVVVAYQQGSTALVQGVIAAIAGIAGYEAYQNGS